MRLQAYQGQLARFYNKQVKLRELKIGDLVLRKTLGNMKNPSEGKLGANWEGPYRVTGKMGQNAYRLTTLEGRSVPRTWNVANLKKFFQ